MTANARPGWAERDESPLRFVISVCGGDADVGRRILELPQAQPLSSWEKTRTGWLEAEFSASPVAAWKWLGAIRESIGDADVYLQPREELGKRLLICDMDMTIVATETLDEVAAILGFGVKIAEITARAMNGDLDFDTALRERIRILSGQPTGVFDDVARSLALNPGAEALISGARAAGVRTILISGGFEQVAIAVAERLGFDEVYCNRLEIEQGRLTGAVIDPIVNAEFKRNKLIERAAALDIPLDACCSIGDGANDLQMLQTSGLGIAYHGKPILRAATYCFIDHTDLSSALAFMGVKASLG